MRPRKCYNTGNLLEKICVCPNHVLTLENELTNQMVYENWTTGQVQYSEGSKDSKGSLGSGHHSKTRL